jgi:hypothetical protein
MSGVSDSSIDNATSLSDMHAPGPGIASASMQTVQLSGHFQSHSSTTPTPLPLVRGLTSAL